MRLIVVSDSHGRTDLLRRIAQSVPADGIVHLGDNTRDTAVFDNGLTLYRVRGNCDFDFSTPDEQLLELEGKRILITHGHNYHVKSGLYELASIASEQKADAVLYGHTHIPGYEYRGHSLLLNPGAVCGDRTTGRSSFAILEWKPGCEIYMQMSHI